MPATRSSPVVVVALVAAACGTSPFTGTYRGDIDAEFEAYLDLRADGSCAFVPLMKNAVNHVLAPSGWWRTHTDDEGQSVIAVQLDQNDPSRVERFVFVVADGQPMLVNAAEGWRLARVK